MKPEFDVSVPVAPMTDETSAKRFYLEYLGMKSTRRGD